MSSVFNETANQKGTTSNRLRESLLYLQYFIEYELLRKFT